MKNLPYALMVEANSLESGSPWLILYEITFPNNQGTAYLVKNTEDVTFQGNEYQAFPLELGTSTESDSGDVQTLEIKISNVTRVMQSYLESLDGVLGSTVKITIVNSANLTADYAELEREFEIIASNADSEWVSFTLGVPNPLIARFPLHRYIANYCNWKFKSVECGYAGAAGACARNLDACRALGNSARFGGHPGLANGGMKIAFG